jgi:DNA-binding winged helix-turn-helix (wHTH) protein/Tfp pilus assembly protein PilF
LNKTTGEANLAHYHFDDVVVDCERFEIEKSGEVRKLTPRAFNLLQYLIEHRDRVVEKPELFEQIWNERFVTDNALTRCVADIRRALQDDAAKPKYIETVPKRGYRFVASLKNGATEISDAMLVLQTGVTPESPVTGGQIPQSRDWLRAAVIALAIVVFGLTVTMVYQLVERENELVGVVPPVEIGGKERERDVTGVCTKSESLTPAGRLGGVDKLKHVGHRGQFEGGAAYQLYVEGNRLLNSLDTTKTQQSLEHFQRAINLDPGFALAHAGLAHYYLIVSEAKPQESVPLAKAAIARALELDPKLAEAFAVRALLQGQYEWDFVAADKNIKRALEIDSTSPVVQQDLALLLSVQGKMDASLQQSKKILAFDPLNARLNLNVGWNLYGTRRYREAQSHFQQMITAGIYLPGSYSWLAQIHEAQGRYDEAMEMDLKYRSLSRAASTQTLAEFRAAYVTGGWRAYLEKILEQRKEVSARRHVEPYIFAMIYARLGDKEETLRWLERACQEKSIFVRRVNSDPAFDSFRREPRFRSMMDQLGFAS